MKGRSSKGLGAIIVILILLLGCIGVLGYFYSKDKTPQDVQKTSVECYFIDKATSTLKSEKEEIEGDTPEQLLQNTMAELKKGPKTEDLTVAIPEKVLVQKVMLDGDTAIIDMSKEYNEMKAGEEALCRASIVWTLTGLDFVDRVEITADGIQLTQTNGEPLGAIGRDDIVLDTEVSPEATDYETVVLYFSNDQATTLVKEERQIEVNPNQPLEKYVVEQLIAGPEDPNDIATVPPETKIRDIKTTSDGICYVDLSAEFVTKHSGGSSSELLTIYSIVDSLCELKHINAVQFLIEGEKQSEFKGHVDFSQPFKPMDVNV
ncbi:MAG: GerMN domain-containing protein [Clostridiales bacterium]|nr:GerMN domain-containing protein [Clostridiales bacterium]